MSLEEPEISSPIQTRVISCFLESPQTDKTISYDKETIDLDLRPIDLLENPNGISEFFRILGFDFSITFAIGRHMSFREIIDYCEKNPKKEPKKIEKILSSCRKQLSQFLFLS